MKNTFVMIGCGGIGYHMADSLVRLVRNIEDSELYLVDGKRVLNKNLARQFGEGDVGRPKAELLAEKLSASLLGPDDSLRIIPIPEFVEYDNFDEHPWITAERLTVFSGVDLNSSRVLLEDIAAQREEMTLLSAGNHIVDGQAVLFRKRDGKNIDPLPSEIDPEILDNDGAMPSEIPCDEAVVSAPQLALANSQAGIAMLSLWYSQVLNEPESGKEFNYVTFNVAEPHVSRFNRPALALATGE